MTMPDFAYHLPEDVDGALRLIAGTPHSLPLAAGQQLLPRLNRRDIAAGAVIDLRRIAELQRITAPAGMTAVIGAMVPLAKAASHPALQGTAFADAVAACGDHATRVKATVGGSIASLEPANDILCALVALGAAVEIATLHGREMHDAARLAADGLPAGALVVAVHLPASGAKTASAHMRLRDMASLYPLCAVSVSLGLDAAGRLTDPLIALTGATGVTRRLDAAEAAVAGQTPASLPASPLVAVSDCRTDTAAGADYRAHLADRFIRSAIANAAFRLGASVAKTTGEPK